MLSELVTLCLKRFSKLTISNRLGILLAKSFALILFFPISGFEANKTENSPNEYIHDIVPTVNLKFKSEIFELLRQDNVIYKH
jgi:hypothetical protein